MNVSLNALKVFDAAARHRSFKAAGEELNLSASAVSHAIAKLEKDLGILLFDRIGRSLALTLDGETLYRPLEEALALIRAGLNAVSTRQSRLLRLHCAPSFGALWLTPRLSDFLVKNPDMEVRIAASTEYSRFTADEFDADITYNRREQDGLIYQSLGKEDIVPMCSPELAQHIQSPADLLKATLIRSTLKRVSWEDWFRANNLQAPDTIGMRFDRSLMAISAAVDGLGVCLDSTRLAERELASGRLVRPLQGIGRDLVEEEHFLVYPRRNAHRPIVMAFSRWLTETIANPSQ